MAINLGGVSIAFELEAYVPSPTWPSFSVTRGLNGVIGDRRVPNRYSVTPVVASPLLSAEESLGFVDSVDIMAFNRAALVTLVYEDGTEGEEFTVPRNGARSVSGRIRGFKYRNATTGTGSSALEVVAWWRE